MPARAGDSSTTGSSCDGPASLGSRPRRLSRHLHPCGNPREHDADVFVGRRREGPEPERVPIAFGEEDAVEKQRLETRRNQVGRT